MSPERAGRGLLDWQIAARPMDGQAVSGDLHLVKTFDQIALLAVVDGVGHGKEAMAAARTAVSILEAHAEESPISLINRCHEALKQTRGVVMTVVSLSATNETITWTGVGSVEGRLLRSEADTSHPSESALLRGGLVGLHLPSLHASVVPVAEGDLLVLATDGIHAGFDESIDVRETPRSIADAVLERHYKGTDDALVLVARYLGGAHA